MSICPFTYDPAHSPVVTGFLNCSEEQCALWHKGTKRCAYLSIAISLQNVAEQLQKGDQ